MSHPTHTHARARKMRKNVGLPCEKQDYVKCVVTSFVNSFIQTERNTVLINPSLCCACNVESTMYYSPVDSSQSLTASSFPGLSILDILDNPGNDEDGERLARV